MIHKREILGLAKSSNLRPQVIEKDYVLGWVLAGIQQHEIGGAWVFKGGTCQKKFRRKKMGGKLNPHKSKEGLPCAGRMGMYVETKF